VNYPDLKITILRSRSNPALPYMRLFTFFNLFTWPSTCPVLSGVFTALLTASKSGSKPLAKLLIPEVDFETSSIHFFKLPVVLSQIIF